MRGALVVAVLVLARIALAQPTGFDHHVHNRDILVSGAESIPCARCHTIKNGLLVGRPDHGACFGACHGPAPVTPRRGTKLALEPAKLELCSNCHTAGSLTAVPFTRAPVTYPPYKPSDFALAIGHKAHRAVTCIQCHLSKGAPHRRCIGCHDGSSAPARGPAMSECATCHTPGSGSPVPPALAEPTDTVTSTFAHDKHAKRGGAGAQCATCHAAILATNDSILPRPTMQSCGIAGCHDGKPAFSITTSCTTCHTKQPASFAVVRPPDRFSHVRPEHMSASLSCAGCHPIDRSGEVLVASHAACIACHADDFSKRTPTTCGACHTATEPWRPLVADRLPRESTEFGATLDHAKHPGACATCHTLRTVSSQLRPPRGHRACTTAGCHATSGGPAPQIGACESCHALGLSTRRVAMRTQPAWSVRTTFDHAPHLRAKDGSAVACTACHDDLSGASVLALPGPAKKTCVPCHDGVTAFKLTGTTCTRCHPGPTR
jgi:predicted CXXCH cytochrome family protein